MSERKILSADQTAVVTELVEAHGLDPEQISFEGTETNPIFDYEAVCALSLKLTDIQDIDCEITNRDVLAGIVSAKCLVRLPDGKTRSSEESASVDEIIGDGKKIETMRLAEQVAQSRAVRRGIRSVGINLFKAHKKFMETGKTVEGHTDNDPRQPTYSEIHVNAAKLGMIVGKDKTIYETIIAEWFDGRTSSKDLNDLELQRFNTQLRSLVRVQNSVSAARQKLAA